MSQYEKINLLLQFGTTAASILACFGVYFAAKSFGLSKLDFNRKLDIESFQYFHEMVNVQEKYKNTFFIIGSMKLHAEDLFVDLQLSNDISWFLNSLESLQQTIDRNFYNKSLLSLYSFIPFGFESIAIPYIDLRRKEQSNMHLWENAEKFLKNVPSR